jgi:hypothetical protein
VWHEIRDTRVRVQCCTYLVYADSDAARTREVTHGRNLHKLPYTGGVCEKYRHFGPFDVMCHVPLEQLIFYTQSASLTQY